MKMIKRKIVTLTAVAMAALVTIGCDTVIDYRGPETEPKVVIYALLQPDSLFVVSVSESHSVFQEKWQPRQIKNATVRVYRDDELLETLTYHNYEPADYYYAVYPYSLYTSQTNRPEFGHTYRVEVEVPGYPRAYGETVLPAPVTVEVIDTSYAYGDYGNRQFNVKLRFRDPAGEENYYRFTAPATMGSYWGDPGQPYDPEQKIYVHINDLSYGALNDPIISPVQEDDIFDMYLHNDYYIFNDELIPGREYNLSLTYNEMIINTEYYEFMRAFFRLNSITRDLYLFLQSFSAYRQTSDNPLAEPVPVYTNVTNGLGVVGALSFTQDSLIIGEYPVEGVQYEQHLY